MSSIVRLPRRKWLRRLVLVAIAAVIAGLLGFVALMATVRLVPFDPASLGSGEVSSIVLDRRGRAMRSYLAGDERWRIPVKLPEVSPHLVKATIAVEDKRFYQHHGIDWLAVTRAFVGNLRPHGMVSGASTLTMQTAAFNDRRDRTVARKLRQAFRALQLEHALRKDAILELYLTHAPYGGNICGVQAAARRYFGKTAAELTLSESALLAGLPQSPSRFRPDRSPGAAWKRAQHVLQRMCACGFITRPEYERVRAKPPAIGDFDSPIEAPHFCDLVHELYPHTPHVRSTLDIDIQHTADRMLRERVAALRPRSVTNASLVVIENATAAVRALVGSIDYLAVADQGQVNGATAMRSPGSALKPLIYGLAMDSGLIAPDTVLYDVPRHYADYQPENFDRAFHGLVPADKALAFSLNVPAIQTLETVGLPCFLRFARECGIDTLRRPAGEYGLSVAIGTCGVRLIELTNAYAMLARGGIARPYELLADTTPRAAKTRTGGTGFDRLIKTPAGRRVLSEAACYFVTKALSDPALRPPETVDPGLLQLERVAWKTGTSNGFRDAWTVAYDNRYTVGVWVGNFDGRASRALVGAEAAAPVALGMIKALRGGTAAGGRAWPERPAAVTPTVVCAETGLIASQDCPSTRIVEAIRAQDTAFDFAAVSASEDVATVSDDSRSTSPRKPLQFPFRGGLPRCEVHRALQIDVQTSTQLCARCAAGRCAVQQVYALWPTSVASWMAENHLAPAAPPPHFAGCVTVSGYQPPRITSPRPDDRYIITSGRQLSAQKIGLEAAVSPSSKRLFWFLDGSLVEAVDVGTQVWITPEPGKHTVRCVDDNGRVDRVSFTVEAAD